MLIYGAVAALITGILFGGAVGNILPLFLCIAVALLALFIFRKRKVYLIALLFLFVVMVGMLRVQSVEDRSLVDHDFTNQQVQVTGQVVDEVDVREGYVRITVEAHTIDADHVDPLRILVSAQKHGISFGDYVYVKGEITKPEDFYTESGRLFRYENFLAVDDIHYQISFPDTVRSWEGSGSSFRGILFSLKHWYLDGISASLPEPHAALGGGITVGAKRSLGDVWLEIFRITGLIHIVVLSGYNVTIIAEAIMRSLTFTSRRIALGVGIFAISGFVLMVGAGATIVRAGIMAVLGLIARATGRTYAVMRALMLAGGIMLLFNPLLLLNDPSFQLSFIATLGLIYIAPRIEQYLGWVPSRLGLREIFSATIGTQIAVLPLLLYLTGLLSFIALFANLLVLPFLPLAMATTFVAGIVGNIINTAAPLFAFPAYLLLGFVLGVADFLAQIPFAAVTVPPFPLWGMVCMYLLILFFIIKTSPFKKDPV